MNIYNEDNPPKRGTALKIWKALKAKGHRIIDLHYNPNCWGAIHDGWGLWVVETQFRIDYTMRFWFVRVQGDRVVLQQPEAPFGMFEIPDMSEKAGDKK